MERVYIVQHPDNPVQFYTHVPRNRWTLDLDQAHGFRTEHFALNAIANHLNGRGYVIPYLRPLPTRRELAAHQAREERFSV